MKKFDVSGMSCAACSARVESAVSKLDGVEKCAVSLLTNSMTVEGDVTAEEVVSAVRRAGYDASLAGKTKKETEKKEKKEKSLLLPLAVSVLLLLVLMVFSMGHMVGLGVPSVFTPAVQGVCQFVLSLSILMIHRRFFVSGFKASLHLSPNMDTLVSLGSGVSFLYSTVQLLRILAAEGREQMNLFHGLYFESAAMILVLITVGKMLEARSKVKTGDAIRALQRLAPEEAVVLRDGVEMTLPLSELAVGDVVVVRPGEGIPADGIVFEGEGAVDESALTGESIPVDKKEGDSVYTGTANLSGRLLVRVEKVGSDTALSRIIERVTAASASKAPIARLADRVSGVFVPVVIAISLLTFGIWLLVGAAFGEALTHGIAVLVVSCPCALGLATPVAIMVANGVAAKHGILFKNAVGLEEAGKTQIVVLDKTGTVTTGNMQVIDVIPAEGIGERKLLEIAAGLEQGSAHPIAAAVIAHARRTDVTPAEMQDYRTRAGYGVEGRLENERYLGGKMEILDGLCAVPDVAVSAANRLSNEGKTPLFFGKEGTFLGLLALSDTLKEDSAEAIGEMKRMGLRVVMITGDRKGTAAAVAAKCRIEEYFAGVLPEEKEDLVQKLKAEGKVMMVGDGINDAPALTAADLGVAIGAGVDVALDAAEVVLMNSSLSDVPKLISLSRKTLTNIKENLFWAFCYNLIGIPLAAGAFEPLWGWSLTPMFGAAAMSVSSLFVVTNALRLNLFSGKKNENRKKKEKKEKEKKKMEKIMKIEGMMCPHCEAHVKKALEAIEGVLEAIPSHEKNEAIVRLSAEVSDAVLKEAVEKEGYKVL